MKQSERLFKDNPDEQSIWPDEICPACGKKGIYQVGKAFFCVHDPRVSVTQNIRQDLPFDRS